MFKIIPKYTSFASHPVGQSYTRRFQSSVLAFPCFLSAASAGESSSVKSNTNCSISFAHARLLTFYLLRLFCIDILVQFRKGWHCEIVVVHLKCLFSTRKRSTDLVRDLLSQVSKAVDNDQLPTRQAILQS